VVEILGTFAVKDVSEYGPAPRDDPSVYPGIPPEYSYLLHDMKVHELRVFGKVWESQLTFGDKTRVLQEVLAEIGQPPLQEWYCILAYGSNACPAQLVHKEKGIMTAVVVKTRLFDVLPVYAGYVTKGGKGYIPATLARAKGQEIETFVTLLKKDDLAKMDSSEGRPSVYQLAEVNEGKLFLENGKELKPIYAYVTTDTKGLYLHEGQIIPVHEVPQAKVCEWMKKEKLSHSETSKWLAMTHLTGPPPKTFEQMF
jgi:hypothetical protein